VPFIIVSGTVGEEVAVDAMRAGARDYVLKDRLARLAPALARELDEAASRQARRKSEAALHKVEEQLRQAQKLEAIGGLAAGIAHDFNNLLSVVLGNCELLSDALPAESPSRAEVAEIHGAGVRAAQLTQQLLAFARRQVLQPRHVNLDAVVADVSKILRRLLGENIDVVVSSTPELGSTFVDVGQIEQVILNLAVNARDAMPDGGVLNIETANLTFEADAIASLPAGNYVMLAVSDTGIGMDDATRARIFEPFFTTKDVGKGTGLGLSTVFGVVEQSGGAVWVYSELRKGTTFKLYFPRSDQRADPLPVHPPELTDLRGHETVLLVEDDAAVRKVVRAVLSRHGHTVIEAANGADAILAASEHPGAIDLLLTDVIMPGISGRSLALELQAKRPALRVLYMSGYTDHSVVHHGVLDPGIAFLQKPVTSHSLMRKVRDALQPECK
jgi:two-component system, cell cycle sensor histidine kinase and response regulator CckA